MQGSPSIVIFREALNDSLLEPQDASVGSFFAYISSEVPPFLSTIGVLVPPRALRNLSANCTGTAFTMIVDDPSDFTSSDLPRFQKA
jgi:hypothetical protein